MIGLGNITATKVPLKRADQFLPEKYIANLQPPHVILAEHQMISYSLALLANHELDDQNPFEGGDLSRSLTDLNLLPHPSDADVVQNGPRNDDPPGAIIVRPQRLQDRKLTYSSRC